jgi:hypothetical protein
MPNPNSAVFPTAVAVDADLLVVKDNAYSNLNGAINGSVTDITFVDATVFHLPCLIAIENEVVKALGPLSGNTIENCERGFIGSAASHSSGVTGYGYIFDWHRNQIAAEIKAIETALGASLGNVIKGAQSAAGDLGGTYPNPTVSTVGGASAASVASAATKAHDQNTDTGTNAGSFQINSAHRIKGVVAGLEARNSGDTDYVDFKAKVITSTGGVGGDLSGDLPNPVLATLSGLSAGESGDADNIPVITIDVKGRITAISTIAVNKDGGTPGGSAGGDLTGSSYPNPTVATVGGKTAAAIATSVNDTVAATESLVVDTIVKRDSNGDFTANEITADLIGNADTATDLETWPEHATIGGSAPTILEGTGAGTTPTIAITGLDNAGKITLTPGTTPAADAIVATVTFNTAFGSAPTVLLVPANKATASLAVTVQPFVSSTTTTTFVITSNGSALTAGTAYAWYFHALGA